MLAITFAQYLNDGLALAAIGQAYQLTVSGAPVWAAAQRPVDADQVAAVAARCLQINRLMAEKMAA